MSSVIGLTDLFPAIRVTQIANYNYVATITFLAHDIALMLPVEIDLIWRQVLSITCVPPVSIEIAGADDSDRRTKWTLPKVLYLWARYHGICFLIFAFNVEFGTGLYSITFTAIKTREKAFVAPPDIPLSGCLTENSNRVYTFVAWVPATVIATIFFLLTLLQLYLSLPEKNKGMQWSNIKGSLTPLLTSFYTDGAIYYFLILSQSQSFCFNCFVPESLTATGALMFATVTSEADLTNAIPALAWTIVVYSFSASRLILNLRRMAVARNPSAPWVHTLTLSWNIPDSNSGLENGDEIDLETMDREAAVDG
ncbi:hypothetical protein V5O48_006669 [Marasmius crinis-equi]|uniref:DUF6533 domain-containing protein n=1 Tax=Marasmius crinis-equi TaxID=585013 RepID=A0ABR3FJR0_9AGAR